MAFERTGTTPYNIENMIKDVMLEFPDVKSDDIVLAMRKGSLGEYGRTYKLTTQEICLWIRQFLSKNDPLDKFKHLL